LQIVEAVWLRQDGRSSRRVEDRRRPAVLLGGDSRRPGGVQRGDGRRRHGRTPTAGDKQHRRGRGQGWGWAPLSARSRGGGRAATAIDELPGCLEAGMEIGAAVGVACGF